MDKLIEEASDPEVKEVVIATSYTPEGEATAHMVAAALKRHIPELRVTRLARGCLPALRWNIRMRRVLRQQWLTAR